MTDSRGRHVLPRSVEGIRPRSVAHAVKGCPQTPPVAFSTLPTPSHLTPPTPSLFHVQLLTALVIDAHPRFNGYDPCAPPQTARLAPFAGLFDV